MSAELAYRLGWRVMRWLPERVAYAVFRVIADIAFARGGRLVAQLERNLARAVPNPREVAKQGMRTYLDYWCEAFRLPDWSRERIVNHVVTHREHVLVEALRKGGVVAALPHMGNWDHAGAWASLMHRQVVSVAERLKPQGLFEEFLRYRSALGMEILAHDDPHVIDTLTDRLNNGGLVALLADRDMTKRGIEVMLLGEITTFPAGPIRLAQSTASTFLPVSLWREHRVLHLYFHDPIDTSNIEQAAQALADVFTAAIAAHPHEWHVLQRVFVADRGRTAPSP